MTSPTIADLRKYADLQMAAEAFLVNETTGDLVGNKREALILGNGHASVFTEAQ